MEPENKKVFIPGLNLARRFYKEAVLPVMERSYPDVQYSAALIGHGSEVLGYDTSMSSDHHWGPRCQLFLKAEDYSAKACRIKDELSWKLPLEFMGYPVNFGEPDPEDNGTQLLQSKGNHPVNHRVEIYTIEDYLKNYLGVTTDSSRAFNLSFAEWLSLPQQKLRTLVSGHVFYDALGIGIIRDYLKWYPDDVWFYLMASNWYRISQEEHLMGRAGYVGDELGSALIGARLVRDIMRLAFYMEKQYPPYAKWLGTAFAQLQCASVLTPLLRQSLTSDSWTQREIFLCDAFEYCAQLHNDLGLTESLNTKVRLFFGRPFKVLKADRFTNALVERIENPIIKSLNPERLFGSLDLISDNTDFLENATILKTISGLFKND